MNLYLEHSSSITTPKIVWEWLTSHVRGNSQYPPLEDLTTWLREDQKRDPLSNIYNWHQKNAGTVPSHNTTRGHPKRGRSCEYPSVENQRIYPIFTLWYISFVLDSFHEVFSIDMYIQKGGAVIYPLDIFFRSDIKVLLLGWMRWGMVSMFVLWEYVFQMAMRQESFFTCGKTLEVVSSQVPLRYIIIKQQVCVMDV